MFTLSRRATLLLLLTAAAGQQVRYVSRAVLPAQDAVDAVSVAQRIEREGLPATVRAEPVPPLFPALVAAMHATLSSFGAIDATDWIRPPQWVAAGALILAVIPIFLTAERIAGRGPAVVATIFYVALPAAARLGADGLGDAVHLCLVAWGAWLLSASRWTVAGIGIAAALLVRAEAAVVPLTVLLLSAVRSEFRRPSFFAAAACCILPFLAVGVTSPNEIIARLRGGAAPTETTPLNAAVPSPPQESALERSLTFGHKDRTRSTRFHGLAATLREFADELGTASGYVLPLLVVAGFLFRRQNGRSDYDVFIVVAVGLQLVILFGMAWKNGYLSTRHFLLPVVLTLPYAALGLIECCHRTGRAKLPPSRSTHEATARREPRPPDYAVIASVGAFVVISLIASSRPVHETVLAHRQAAEWLQTAAGPGAVLDQQGYTALTSGRTTYRYDAAERAFADQNLRYVLLERGDLEADSPRGRSLRAVLGGANATVKTFIAPGGRIERDVCVFTRPPQGYAYRGENHAR